MKELDEKLLAALRDDARRSVSELARELGISRSTVQGRIRRLEHSGIIAGYSVTLGAAYRAGLIRAHVLIKLDQRLTARINRQLAAIPQLVSIHAISGDFDLIVEVEADSTQALNRLLDQISALDGVARTQTSVILETRLQR